MVRYLLLTFTFLLGSVMLFAQDASIQGKVTDKETNEPIIYGNIALFKDGNLVTGTDTDFDGNYHLSNLDPGTYDVVASYDDFIENLQKMSLRCKRNYRK